MEATKKKKAYLKPEMTKFEMKMESIMQTTSKPSVIVPEESVDTIIGQLTPGCIDPQNPASIPAGKCFEYTAHTNGGNDCPLWDYMEQELKVSLVNGALVELCKLETGDFKATLLRNSKK